MSEWASSPSNLTLHVTGAFRSDPLMVSGPPLESPRFPDFAHALTRRARSLASSVQTLNPL